MCVVAIDRNLFEMRVIVKELGLNRRGVWEDRRDVRKCGQDMAGLARLFCAVEENSASWRVRAGLGLTGAA